MSFILESALLATGAASTAAEATALAGTIGSVASVGGSIIGAFGQIQSGQQAQQLAEYNATLARNNAAAADQAGQQEAGRLYDQHRRAMATARATQGASGADVNLGSPVDVMADLAGQAALDEEIARWRGRRAAAGYRNEAASQQYQGQMAASTAWGRAGAMLLTGFGRFGSPYTPSYATGGGSYGGGFA